MLQPSASGEKVDVKPIAPKPIAAKPAAGVVDAEPKQLQCDRTADWARAENLTVSLINQQANPDEVFFPLPSQRTCELTDIFSAPRRRERAKGSGDWTPASAEAKPAPEKDVDEERAEVCMTLVGMDGEYAGEVLFLPAGLGATEYKSVIVGRSSGCDVTLSRDDQISRRHLQIEATEGKLVVRDLGSTCAVHADAARLYIIAPPDPIP